MSKPVIVSFFTKEWEYEERANALIHRCNELGIAYDIQARESRGNWNHNTAMKAEFIAEMLQKHEHIIWMDCDGQLKAVPALCLAHNPPEPILAVKHQTMDRNWHVCVLSIRRTDATTALVDMWANYVRHNDVTDELAFHEITCQLRGLVRALPERYCALPHDGKFQADAVWCQGVSTSPDKMAMKARQATKK